MNREPGHLSGNPPEEDTRRLLVAWLGWLRMVFAALVVGILLFGGVAVLFSGPLELELPPDTTSLVLIAISVVTGMQGLAAPAIIRGAAVKSLPADVTIERLARIWFSSMLVGLALLESAVFLNLVGLFLSANLVHLPAAGIFAILMFAHYPGTHRLYDWIDRGLASRQNTF